MGLRRVIVSVLLSGPLFGSPSVEFTSNEIHGLINFLETISGHPHRSETLKDFFVKSRYNKPEVRGKIEEFNRLSAELEKSIEFLGYPKDRHIGISVDQLFLI